MGGVFAFALNSMQKSFLIFLRVRVTWSRAVLAVLLLHHFYERSICLLHPGMSSLEAKLCSPAHIFAPVMIPVVKCNFKKSQDMTAIFTCAKLWEIFDKVGLNHWLQFLLHEDECGQKNDLSSL